MRIVKIILILVIISLAGYWFVWNKHANQSKDQLISRIEQLNKTAGLSADDFHVGYDDIRLGGFPFGVKLKIENPSIRYNEKAILHLIAPQIAQANAIENEVNNENVDSTPKLIEDWKLDGTLSLEGQYLERSFAAIFDGTTTGTSTRHGNVLNIKSTIDGDSTCRVTLNKDASFSVLNEDLFSQFKDKELFLKTFQSIDCHSDKSEMVNIDTEETLFSMDESHIRFSSKILSDDEKDIGLVVKLKDVYQSKQWEQWIANTRDMLQPSIKSTNYLFNNPAEGLSSGVQNVNINANYRGITDFANLNSGSADLELKTFELQNDLFSISAPIKLFIERKNNKETVRINGNQSVEIAPEFTDHLKNYINYIVNYATDEKNQHPDTIHYQTWARQNGGTDKLITILQDLVPDFEAIGKIELKTDVNYDVKNDPQGFDNKKNLNVKEISLKMKPYSLVAGGKISLADMKSDLSLRCHSCDELTSDLLRFYSKTDKLYTMGDSISKNKITDTEKFVKLTQAFIHQVTTQEDDGKTLLLTVKDNGKGELLISGKPIFQVMMLWTQIFVPNMKDQFKPNKDGSIRLPKP